MARTQITDKSGNNRLSTFGVSGYWDRIIWEYKDGSRWTVKMEITRQAFQIGDGTKRWIESLDTFDPNAGTAIIKVAHGDARERNPSGVNYIYSWREWDLRANRELRFLRLCENPHEDSYSSAP